jgi:hypothetical protein
MPSHPSIRLWEDSRERLLDPQAKVAPPVHFTVKGRFLAGSSLVHCNQPRRLRAAYFLGEGSTHGVTFRRIDGAEALLHWITHAFLLDIEDHHLIRRSFEGAVRLANTVACFHLDYPRRYEDLGHLMQAIVEHASSEGLR